MLVCLIVFPLGASRQARTIKLVANGFSLISGARRHVPPYAIRDVTVQNDNSVIFTHKLFATVGGQKIQKIAAKSDTFLATSPSQVVPKFVWEFNSLDFSVIKYVLTHIKKKAAKCRPLPAS